MCLAQIAAICLPSRLPSFGHGRILVGASPETEIRKHGYYYPACKSKCEPILGHMLQGLDVEPTPMKAASTLTTNRNSSTKTNGWLQSTNRPACFPYPARAMLLPYGVGRVRIFLSHGPLLVHRPGHGHLGSAPHCQRPGNAPAVATTV